MKKILSIISIFVMALVLVACGQESNENLQDAYDRLQLDVTDTNAVTGTVVLATELAHGAVAEWSVDNTANVLITERRGETLAVISQPLFAEGQKAATISATIVLGGAKLTKEFSIKIPTLAENLQDVASISALRKLEIGGKDQPTTLPIRMQDVTVVGLDQDAYYVTDGTDVTLVFTEPKGIAVGDKGTVIGNAAIYYNAYQISGASFITDTVDNVVTPKAAELSAYNFLSYKSDAKEVQSAKNATELLQLVEFTALVVMRPDFTGGANYTTTLVGKNAEGVYDADANFALSYYKHDNHAELAKYNGQEVKITATVRELRENRTLQLGVSKPVFSISVHTISSLGEATAANKVVVDANFAMEQNYPKAGALVVPAEGLVFKTPITWTLKNAADAEYVNITEKTVSPKVGVRATVVLVATIGTKQVEKTIYVGEYLTKTTAEVKLAADKTAVVKITGILTSDLLTNTSGTSVSSYTLTDASGAITVRISNADRAKMVVGKEYQLVGSYDAYNGLVQFVVTTIIDNGVKTVPAALDITAVAIADLLQHQSKEVKLVNVEITEKTTPNNAIQLIVKQGEVTWTVRIDTRYQNNAANKTAMEALVVGDKITVTGNLQWFNNPQIAIHSGSVVSKA